VKNFVFKVSLLLCIVYAVVCFVLYFLQTPLTFPGSIMEFRDKERALSLGRVKHLKEVKWTNSLDEQLDGFEIDNSSVKDNHVDGSHQSQLPSSQQDHAVINEDSATRYIIYFGGNADDVWKSTPVLNHPRTVSRSLNYPGFAASEGDISEENILNSMKDWVNSLGFKSTDRLTFIGRSLGSGVATQIAYWVQQQGIVNPEKLSLVLITPYDALWKVGRSRFPWIPVNLIMTSRLESDLVIGDFRGDLHIVISEVDTRVPHDRTEELVNAYLSRAQDLARLKQPVFTQDTIFGHHHNNILNSTKLESLLHRYSR
jgi:hypothetical protein